MSDDADIVKQILSGFGSRGFAVIQYAGGDNFILKELMSAISRAPCKRCTLVEVFGGGGVVSQHAPRSKFKVIIYNDIDSLLTEFYSYLKQNPDMLQKVLALIPYSREFHKAFLEIMDKHADELRGIVAASVLFYVANTAFLGKIGSMDFDVAKKMNNKARTFSGRVQRIVEASRRFRDVVIENLDFEECVKRYDSTSTVFYLDPPYLSSDRTNRSSYYRFSFSENDVARLVRILNGIQGYYLLKLHEDQLPHYSGLNYRSRKEITKCLFMSKEKDNRRLWRVVLLANYDLSGGLPAGTSSKFLIRSLREEA
ncbi:MAG: DNA adenine methylase [Nanopusillaceae archaeon]